MSLFLFFSLLFFLISFRFFFLFFSLRFVLLSVTLSPFAFLSSSCRQTLLLLWLHLVSRSYYYPLTWLSSYASLSFMILFALPRTAFESYSPKAKKKKRCLSRVKAQFLFCFVSSSQTFHPLFTLFLLPLFPLSLLSAVVHILAYSSTYPPSFPRSFASCVCPPPPSEGQSFFLLQFIPAQSPPIYLLPPPDVPLSSDLYLNSNYISPISFLIDCNH